MEYQCIVFGSAHRLTHAVNEYIKEGWRPQGGVAITHNAWFAQALVREKPDA